MQAASALEDRLLPLSPVFTHIAIQKV